MNDKIIIKAIPKLHFRITLFLFLFFLVFFFTFIALIEGFSVERLKLGNVKIEKLYLKWNNALLIHASKIDLSDLKSDNSPLTLEPLSKLPTYVRYMEWWVEEININTIQYKDINTSIVYRKKSPGFITVRHGSSSYNGNFTLDQNFFNLKMPDMVLKDANISATLFVNLNKQSLLADIFLSLPNIPNIRIKAHGDSDSLRLSATADKEFTTVKPIVDFLGVDPIVTPWIVDYAKAASMRLTHLSGTFRYNNPQDLLEALQVDAIVSRGEYTFATGIDPIKAPKVNLKFLKGKLYIYPQNGTFYTLPTEKSYLFIDFMTPNVMLNAFIQTHHGKLNDPILGLLNHYKIHVPIKQLTGECNVDLNLSVNLGTLKTTAQGTFQPSSSELLLDQLPLRSEGGIVKLDTTRVTFKDFIVHYGDNVAHANVNGEYDAHNDKGMVSINAYAAALGSGEHLKLHDPLQISYVIEPGQDTLSIKPSTWNLMGEKLHIGAFRAPFDYHRAFITTPSVPFTVSDKVLGHFKAIFNGAEKKTDVQLRVDHLNTNEIQLQNSALDINVRYNNGVTSIQNTNASAWSVHRLPVLISPLKATLINDEIVFERIETVLGDILKGNVTGKYRLDTQKGSMNISDMIPLNPKLAPIIDKKESVSLALDASMNEIHLNSEALKVHFSTIPQGWKIYVGDISLLSRKSPILRRYNIENGHLNLFYTGEISRYTFDGEINYPYSLMVLNDQPISRYRFSGAYQDGRSAIRINDRLTLTHHAAEGIIIRANNTGINMPQLTKFLSGHRETISTAQSDSLSEATSESLPIRIIATNTYLYLMKDRRIMADALNATLHNNDFDASLQHMGGSAVLKMRSGVFYINGSNFNDKFMEHLFTFGDFSGGTFSFQAKGESDNFEGIMRVENTLLREYKILNNVLAFINTIPSLTTFSLPNYNTKGLPVKEGYLHFSYNRGILNVDNLTINSPEIKILGEGNANIDTQTLLATLTLKSDLGSMLGRVPMVGYILMGQDGSISTTVTVTGKLDNPKVETAFAKEIVTAPFNILKRTLVFPFLWMIEDEKKK